MVHNCTDEVNNNEYISHNWQTITANYAPSDYSWHKVRLDCRILNCYDICNSLHSAYTRVLKLITNLNSALGL